MIKYIASVAKAHTDSMKTLMTTERSANNSDVHYFFQDKCGLTFALQSFPEMYLMYLSLIEKSVSNNREIKLQTLFLLFTSNFKVIGPSTCVVNVDMNLLFTVS